MKTVMHVIIGLNTGGAELMLKRLIECFQAQPRYRHSVVSLTGYGTVGPALLARGVEVRALEMRSWRDLPSVFLRLVRVIRASNPDVVQTWMYHADLIGGVAARVAGNRQVIWGIRTTAVSAGGKRSTLAIRTVCSALSNWIPRAIVCAADASRVAHIAAGYEGSRMVVIPNGFDFSRLTATSDERAVLRETCGFSGDDVVVGTVGRFHRAKDHANFVRAAGIAASKHKNVRFLMVGRDLDANNRELQGWIDATGYGDRFVLLGERKDVPICLSVMDVFCQSSRTEGFPNAVGEAMAMGLPCVATDVGDSAILIGDAGIIVPQENSSELANGLLWCLHATPERRKAMGQLGQSRVRAEFSIERACERFEIVYQRLLETSAVVRKIAPKDRKC